MLGTVAMLNFQKKHMMVRSTKVDPEAVKELLELAKKFPKESAFASIYGSYASMIEKSDGKEKATKFLDDGLKVFGEDSPIGGMIRNKNILGKPC